MRSKTLKSTEDADVDSVAKKHALMSELAATMSESQVLERDNRWLHSEIVTAGMSCVHFSVHSKVSYM